jgi:putative nucleotidyltransferase with HDIG domain
MNAVTSSPDSPDLCTPLKLPALRDLPALPAAVLELLELMGRDDVDSAVLAAKISRDQALTAKTLRLANSSFYGMPRSVASVPEAITVLGMRTVRMVVTAAALTGSFKPPNCAGFDFMDFWSQSVGTAVGARLVATVVGGDAETAFTAGLLHDIGQLVLASVFPERFAQVLAHCTSTQIALCDAERALLGTDHAAVGALVAEHWHLPCSIVDAIGSHHVGAAQTAASQLARIVHVADQLAHATACGGRDGIWAGLGLSGDDWTRLLAETELQTQSICAALLT